MSSDGALLLALPSAVIWVAEDCQVHRMIETLRGQDPRGRDRGSGRASVGLPRTPALECGVGLHILHLEESLPNPQAPSAELCGVTEATGEVSAVKTRRGVAPRAAESSEGVGARHRREWLTPCSPEGGSALAGGL